MPAAATTGLAVKVAKSGLIRKLVRIGLTVYLVGFLALIAFAVTVLGGSMESEGMTEPANGARVPVEYVATVMAAADECEAVDAPTIAAVIHVASGWDPEFHDEFRDVGQDRLGLGAYTARDWTRLNGRVAESRRDATASIMTVAVELCGLDNILSIVEPDPAVRARMTIAARMYGIAAVEDAHGVPDVDGALEYVNAVEEARTSLALQFGGGVESSELGARIVAQARSAIGTPYIWAGGTPSGPSAPNGGTKGFDCSGLVMWAVYNASDGKIALPHLAKSQGGLGQAVLTARGNQADLSLMSPGDVIAFKLSNRVGTSPTDYDHVGIYIGGGRMIHAPKPGSYVSEADLSSSYWATTMWTVRRMG